MEQNTKQLERMSVSKLAPSSVNIRTSEGSSSVFYFTIKKGQKVFRYDVEINRVAGEIHRSQTKLGADDGQKYFFSKICKEAMEIVYKRTQNFGGIQYVYDNRKNLFTNVVLNIQKVHQLVASDFSKDTAQILKNDAVHIEIKACQTNQHTIDLCDVSTSMQTNVLLPADHTLRMFLELVTSQHFINENTHTSVGMGMIFDNNVLRQIDNNNLVLHEGIYKGVRIVENEAQPVPALVADVKTCAFFTPIKLDVAVLNMNKNGSPQFEDRRFWDGFLTFYAGVRVAPIYDSGRTFVISTLSSRKLSDFSFEKDGQKISLKNYYEQNKNIQLQYLNWPVVRSDSQRENVYPLEVLKVLPFQRITIDKMSDNVSRALLEANTIFPDRRYTQILEKVRLIGYEAGPCGRFLEMFGLKLVGNKNTITVKVRAPPAIKFGDKQVTPNNGNFFDTRFRYYNPVSLLKLWVVAYSRNVQKVDVEKLISDMIRSANFKGVTLPQPVQYINFSVEDMTERMSELSKRKIQFVTFIDQKFVKSHGLLKLNERRFGILTQHITIEVVKKAGAATLTNLVNKMHMKIAFKEGLNYIPIMESLALKRFDISKGHVLVIGLDSSNAPRASPFERFKLRQEKTDTDSYEPSFIGVTANYVTQPFSFCGTYFYQKSKQDAINRDKLKAYTTWLLKKVQKNRKIPSVIFIIRDGVSEGHVSNVIKNEFSAIKEACRVFSPDIKFVMCIVDKKHHKRLFNGKVGNGARIENLMPSSVVDSKIVRPDIPEFYLQSHKPLKGTGNVPQYLFPVNEANASNDELQAFINGLCHAFQIVTLAPSLPAPVLIAHEMAKRGRNNYIELKRIGLVPLVANSKMVDIEKLNSMLSYSEHMFSDTRFNA